VPNSLPLARTSFVGRAGEVADLERLLAEAAVVTLVGVGGVGKTRLALEVARRVVDRFPGGVPFVDLAPLRSADRVGPEVARAAGVVAGADDATDLVAEQVGERPLLLVLDNCEHVVDAVAPLAHRLVGVCPNLRVLATSREPLAIGPEVTVPVRPLPAAEAVRLFVDRARAASPGYAGVDADAALAPICARLDGIPLAIELAAPWVRLFSPAELLARLADRFDVLVSARRDLPPRQRTMRAAVEWSHSLLPDEQKVLFRRLAAFTGTFGVEAAERVAGFGPLGPDHVAALLAGLQDRSMLVVDPSPGGSRCRLLETLRDFAAERLAASGEAAALARRHATYYLDRAERADEERLRTGSDAGVAALVQDGDNYRTALISTIEHDPPSALRLAGAVEGFWMVRSVAEGRAWLERALDAAPDQTRHRARALMVSPLVVAGGIPWPRARALVEESIRIYERLGDETGAALATLMMSLAALFHGDLAEARRRAEDVRARPVHRTHPLLRARAASYLGAALTFTPRRLAEGRRLLADGGAASEAIGDRWGQGMALTVLGLADIRAGDREPAGRHLREALRTTLQAGVTAAAIGGLGELASERGPRRGLTLLEAAVAFRDRAGVPSFPVHIGQQIDDALAAARRRLPAPVAEQYRLRARGMTADEVIAYALAETETEPGPMDGLTARQQEIALLVAEGLTNREIAERLHLSVRTVETHVENILSALGLRGRVRLAAWARDAGLSGRVT
jgi:predicted ATPase/DNA-binding CsgD family transcriptional regulator